MVEIKPHEAGLFEFVLPSDRKTILVARFSASHGDLPLRWGSHVEDEHRGTGIWLLCSDELVVERRRAPLKWVELRPILEQEGISLRGTLLEYVARASFDAKRTLFLVGFPIPKAVAGEKVEVHWQPIFLSDWRVAPQGIRPSKHEIIIQYALMEGVMSPSKLIPWGSSTNVSPNRFFGPRSSPEGASGNQCVACGVRIARECNRKSLDAWGASEDCAVRW